jgi:hypothetical protein
MSDMKLELGVSAQQRQGSEFVEVLSGTDKEFSEEGVLNDQLRELKLKSNFSKNMESNAAVEAAITYLI